MGWGLAMFIMGIGLDYSETFRNHPCPTKNTTEKNYTLCFVTCSLFMLAAMLVGKYSHLNVLYLVVFVNQSLYANMLAVSIALRIFSIFGHIWLCAKCLFGHNLLFFPLEG